MPDGWCWASLNSACTILGRIGFRGYTKDDLVDSTGAITLSPSNIVDGVMNYEKCTYISWKKYEESPEIQVQNEDILLVKTGSSYGKCAYVESLPKEATINPQFVVLKFIGCNPRFLTYCLQSNYARNQYEKFVLGTAIPTFTQVALGAMAIPMPPIEEQERIVEEVEKLLSFVDSLDENTNGLGNAITVAKSKILDLAIHGKLVPHDASDEPASELLKRINPKAVASCDNPQYVNRMFEKMNMNYELPVGWCWCRLEELFQFIRNGKNIKQIKGAKGYPITRIETISNSIIDRDRMGYANITQIDGFEDYILRNGDILMSHINSPIHVGKSALCCNISKDEVILHGMNLLCLRPHPGVDSFYLDLYFKSSLFRNLIRPYIKNAVNQASINTKNVGQTYIPFPPKAEQKRLVNKVTELYSLLLQIELSLQA